MELISDSQGINMLWKQFQMMAQRRGLSFTITEGYLLGIWHGQQGFCYLSGVPLTLGKRRTASLDRIDNNEPYEPGNVLFCHKEVNMLKHNKSTSDLVYWAKMISANVGKSFE